MTIAEYYDQNADKWAAAYIYDGLWLTYAADDTYSLNDDSGQSVRLNGDEDLEAVVSDWQDSWLGDER